MKPTMQSRDDKSLKMSNRKPSEKFLEVARQQTNGDECKLQFVIWAYGTHLDIAGIYTGEPLFRPAACAWAAWQGAWKLLRGTPSDTTS